MNKEELIAILKAQQWAKCKGELQAFIAISGCKNSEYEGCVNLKGEYKYIEEFVNEFIEKIESDGLDE